MNEFDYVLSGLRVHRDTTPPRWTLDYFEDEDLPDEAFHALGWTGSDGVFELPAGTPPGLAGRIVARTCVLVGADVDADFWMFRNIDDVAVCTRSLRLFIEKGDDSDLIARG